MAALTILYFASVREAIGVSEERIALPEGVTTPAALCTWLAARSPGHAAALGDRETLRCAVNQHMVGLDSPLAGATEIAFFPPVTGG